jgi:hypothetical protein
LRVEHEGVGYLFFGGVGEFYVGVPFSDGPNKDQESVVLFRDPGGVSALHHLDCEGIGFSDVFDVRSLRGHEGAEDVRLNPKALGDFVQGGEGLVSGSD